MLWNISAHASAKAPLSLSFPPGEREREKNERGMVVVEKKKRQKDRYAKEMPIIRDCYSDGKELGLLRGSAERYNE